MPWSTWPITVTTGGRDISSAVEMGTSSRKVSGSSSLEATALWPISSTRIIAVSWSSTWLMVTIWPSFIRCLMTSAALTDILWARSATVMVSAICTSRTTGSLDPAPWASSRWSRWRPPPRGPPRQPLAPPVSPRVLSARRLAPSSCHEEDSFSDLTCFLSLPSAAGAGAPGLGSGLPVAGRCSVPVVAAPLAPGAPGLPGATGALATTGGATTGGGASTTLGCGRRCALISRLISATSASALRRASARTSASC